MWRTFAERGSTLAYFLVFLRALAVGDCKGSVVLLSVHPDSFSGRKGIDYLSPWLCEKLRFKGLVE
jgi:hypothetical protein